MGSDSTAARLVPGAQLGPYQIGAKLGEGGMGQVFRARDTRLRRDVAIKVCAERFSDRFQREARAIATLNHPNICTVYDVGPDFLVMELVEGETLAAHIRRGPIPLRDALIIARQIATAIEAAHENGIVHRDLKPGNVMVKPDGTIKVLDFGLAKQMPSQSEPGESTLSIVQTEPGVLVGTAAYMSPEQMRGGDIDKRGDIWSFGVVLYEMLTGDQPFAGSSLSDTVAAVLTREPDWQSVPAPARRLLKRCLEKDRKHRLRDVGDAALELEELQGDSTEVAVSTPRPSVSRRRIWPFLAAMALVVAVAAILRLGQSPPAGRPSVTRTTIYLPPDQTMGETLPTGSGPTRHPLAISPDGRFLVYAASSRGTSQLFLRALDDFDSRLLPGTEGANFPVFSPDGRWVAFFADHRLQKVPLTGGAPLTVCNVPVIGRGASWGTRDTIVFSAGNPASLWRVPAAGGTPTEITKASGGDTTYHSWPHVLPDGKSVVFSVGVHGSGGIALLSLEKGEWRLLLAAQAKQARYVPTGHLVYAVEGAIRAVPFDLATLRIAGSPAPVLDPVFDESNAGATDFAVSDNGTLAYVPGGVNFRLVWVNRAGRITPVTGEQKGYRFPALSPDGTQLSVTVDPPDQGRSAIWIYEISSGTGRRLTHEGHNLYSIWTADGSRVAWACGGICWQRADGTGSSELLYRGRASPKAFSSDGRMLLFSFQDPATGWDLAAVRLNGDQERIVVANSRAREIGAAISPDGRWLAFSSDESGRPEIYVQPFPVPGRRIRISADGGDWPVWAGNGELFYKNGAQMVAVRFQPGEGVRFGKPEVLFENWSLVASGNNPRFDVTRDGQKFLMIQDTNRIQGTELRVVLNWLEDVKQRVPGS